jgi:Kef-type K+ transport system membrane component KefB
MKTRVLLMGSAASLLYIAWPTLVEICNNRDWAWLITIVVAYCATIGVFFSMGKYLLRKIIRYIKKKLGEKKELLIN